jgi:leucyl/phenylalanyl-tRNA---protein transferase
MVEITPELVLKAYAAGIFPMAESRDDPEMFWVDPEWRGILPLESFHLPKRLSRTVRAERFSVTADRDFDRVIRACASSREGHRDTWINTRIVELFTALHRRGYVHSIEAWQDDALVGGLYGVALGAAFFGESMFSIRRDASKVALVHLVGRLIVGGFQLLDTQFVTEHLEQFGAVEISRRDYRRRLDAALHQRADFSCAGAELSAATVLQSITQTS